MTKAHKGDPCIYCNTPHADVPVGDCQGRPMTPPFDPALVELVARARLIFFRLPTS